MADETLAGETASSRAGGEISLLRLYVLRAMYAIVIVGLGAVVWPTYLSRAPELPLFNGVARTMLAAFSILCLLGLRYPLRMLPVLLWELLWKAMWLVMIALPLWADGRLDERTAQTVVDCLVGVVLVPLAMPWGYVWRRYFRRPGDRWH